MLVSHIRQDNTEQSTETHLLETGDMCARFGRKLGLPQTARLAGLTHDMGKLTRKFDSYLRYAVAHPEDTSLRGTVPHAIQGAKFVYGQAEGADTAENMAACMVSLAVAGHHGGLSDCLSPEGDQTFLTKLSNEDENLCYEEAQKNFAALPLSADIGALLTAAGSELTELARAMRERQMNVDFVWHLVVKFLFSCLVDADRTGTYLFQTAQRETAPEPSHWAFWLVKLNERTETFDMSTHINRLRADIARSCSRFARRETGVYRLSVPTGGGKTLSSLRFALEHAGIHSKERIVYVIPFLSILDQNAREMKDVLTLEHLILEHHSGLAEEKKQEGYNLFTERWDSPLIITTMVQFLNTLFESNPGNLRRLHHLANAVIIFDEIQSAPLRVINLLNMVLNFLSRLLNTTVVLCSATQPQLTTTTHPLLESRDAEMVPNVDQLFRALKRTRLVNAQTNGGYRHGELAEFMLDKLREGRLPSGLMILNTKRDALRVFDELTHRNGELPEGERYNLIHLSTGMCPAHRKHLLEHVVHHLKQKDGPDSRLICVSTQLIEAGIDVSFTCVVRALAGLDNIAQAAGRCNRHGETSCRDVYVVNVAGENLRHLKDIETAQKAANRIFEELKHEPEADPLAPEVMARYYRYYFHDNRNEMDYRVNEENTFLYDLLGKNLAGAGALLGKGEQPKLPLRQAYDTAGRYFEAIDSDTTPVLAPYGAGRELIEKLRGQPRMEEYKLLFREAQQYSINIYRWQFEKLEKAGALQPLPCDMWALDNRFYHMQTGLSPHGWAMDFLSD